MRSGSLSELDILHGTFTVMFVILSIVLGLIILTKAIRIKSREIIPVGLSLVFLSSNWWQSAFAFLFFIFFNYKIDTFTYLFIGNFFGPITISCWIYTFSDFIYPHLKKKLMTITLIICIPYDVVLVILLIIDPSIIGTRVGLLYYAPNLYAMIFQLFGAAVIIITGVLFSIKTIRSEDPKVSWKGRFFLMAMIFITTGVLLDIGFTKNPIILVIDRIILMLGSILFYLGFLLPDSIAKLFIKELRQK